MFMQSLRLLFCLQIKLDMIITSSGDALTCDDPGGDVQVNYGMRERADRHPETTQHSSKHHCRPTAEAVHQYTAQRTWKRHKNNKKGLKKTNEGSFLIKCKINVWIISFKYSLYNIVCVPSFKRKLAANFHKRAEPLHPIETLQKQQATNNDGKNTYLQVQCFWKVSVKSMQLL